MSPINEIIVTYVTNALWMTCVIASVSEVLSRALRRGPSANRHALWVAAVLLAVVLPLASLRGSRIADKPTSESVAEARVVQPAEKGVTGTSWALWRRMRNADEALQFGPLWVGLVAMLYLSFVTYRAIRLFCGWWALSTMVRQSSEPRVSPAMRNAVDQCQSLLGMKSVPILLSREDQWPATLGVCNPILLLPESFFSEASGDELSAVLGHELAHVRRHDFVLNLLYELLILPISFHPAAALIKARIDQTRELACDEIAAKCLSTNAQYARSLLSIAQSMAAKQRPPAIGYTMGLCDTNTLEDRIMNLLTRANHSRQTWSRVSAVSAATLLIAACLAVSAFSVQVTQNHSTDADLQPFVGTWQAKFKGKTFQTIKLAKKQDALTGTVSHADINVDPKSGELTGVSVGEGEDAISEARLTNGTLLITSQDVQFEMKLTGANQAQLQVVVPPEVARTVPAVKPWKLERVKPNQ
ncbi:MAG: M56 family metallopeptidase [Terriglobales bacterium]|jgi:beta-lactamase regulating signal transducer with metallopeptidase domain